MGVILFFRQGEGRADADGVLHAHGAILVVVVVVVAAVVAVVVVVVVVIAAVASDLTAAYAATIALASAVAAATALTAVAVFALRCPALCASLFWLLSKKKKRSSGNTIKTQKWSPIRMPCRLGRWVHAFLTFYFVSQMCCQTYVCFSLSDSRLEIGQ